MNWFTMHKCIKCKCELVFGTSHFCINDSVHLGKHGIPYQNMLNAWAVDLSYKAVNMVNTTLHLNNDLEKAE